MNYQPTKNTKKAQIVKESSIGKSKWADRIGYFLYKVIRVFKKPQNESNPYFLWLVTKMPMPYKKHYWNKLGTECVDFDCNGFDLMLGVNNGYILLRLHNKSQYIDKAVRLNASKKGLQELLGVINSMQISLKDKVNKA